MDPSSRGNITTRALAAELGLSHSAVAAVLRGDRRRTSEATRQRILEHAKARHYLAHPAAAALAARRSGTPSTRPYNLGICTSGPFSKGLHPLYTACRLCAAAVGYGCEILYAEDFRSAEHVQNVIRSRGIGALIIDTLAEGVDSFPLPDPLPPVVKIHDGLPDLPAPMVSFDQYRQTRIGFRIAWERGYRKIGMTLPSTPLIASANRVRLSALLGIQSLYHEPLEPRCLLELPHPLNRAGRIAVIQWVRDFGIDCILLHDPSLVPDLLAAGHRIPQTLGVIGLHIDETRSKSVSPQLAGFTLIPNRLADAAVRHLDSLLRQPPESTPAPPSVHLVQPDWMDGESLR